jgi:hypothetical protein
MTKCSWPFNSAHVLNLRPEIDAHPAWPAPFGRAFPAADDEQWPITPFAYRRMSDFVKDFVRRPRRTPNRSQRPASEILHKIGTAQAGRMFSGSPPTRDIRQRGRHFVSGLPSAHLGRQCSLIIRKLPAGGAKIPLLLVARIPSAGIDQRRTIMPYRSLTGAFALAATLTLSINGPQAFDETKFPNWKGQ